MDILPVLFDVRVGMLDGGLLDVWQRLLVEIRRTGEEGRDLKFSLLLGRRVRVADEVILEQRLRRRRRRVVGRGLLVNYGLRLGQVLVAVAAQERQRLEQNSQNFSTSQ